MKKEYPRNRFIYLLIICIFVFFHACGFPEEEETASSGASTADSLSLALSQVSVKSDNSDSSTITATVLDDNNASLEGVSVIFTTTGGEISASSATTDSSGDCQITFSAGPESSNQTVTITATVTGLTSRQIPVQITGSTITLTTDSSGLEIGGDDTATLTITVADAGSLPIYDTAVTVSVDAASTGVASLSSSTGNTDVNGVLTVDVTGTGAGSVIVRVAAAGVTATKTYTVGTTGAVFGITSPTQDPASLSTNTNLIITVNAPSMSNVVFGTTIGAWDGGTDSVVTKAVAGGTASATLRSTVAGVATVQAYDNDNPSTSDSLTVAVSAPSSEAAKIALQASSTVVAPSVGSTTNTVTLEATVKNASDQVVGNAAVGFSIQNPTGGGETISPVIVYTNDYGEATSTFTAGSLSSDADGVTIKATVIGSAPEVSSSLTIVIGGTAGSIMIGHSTTMTSINSNTAYQLPMSVLVSDTNGNPMSGTQVSLKIWPTQYSTGTTICTSTGDFINEDINKNLILDAGEDTNGDGQLTPPNSAAGSVPSTVTTDTNGVATFNLVYLKESACWVEVEMTASTLVLGTETQSTYKFWFGWIVAEKSNLPPSPYGP
ncbi:MAG: Ig-like domain-containing protein [Desulfobacteraceae bacterium]|nr:Ig-like domain-containing protein [Desulfobacteraceae bacterium]